MNVVLTVVQMLIGASVKAVVVADIVTMIAVKTLAAALIHYQMCRVIGVMVKGVGGFVCQIARRTKNDKKM